MVDIGNAVNLILKADAGVSALVGTRIYPGPMPPNALTPAIIRWLVDREEIPTLDDIPSVSTLVRTEIRLISVAKSVTTENSQVQAFAIFNAINRCLRYFVRSYVFSISSPTEKIWIDGFSEARNFQESFNEQTFAWETSATYDVWSKPTT